MQYVSELVLPPRGAAEGALAEAKNNRTCYQNVYPFGVFDGWKEERLPLAPLTVFYGGNGSGKTTLLNLLGEKLGLERRSLYNSSHFFDNYAALCQCRLTGKRWKVGQVLASDDVFDDLLDQRSLNQGIDLEVILSTHSPFLLAMPGAVVYDLDQRPIQAAVWTALPAVRAYYEFFKEHGEELDSAE